MDMRIYTGDGGKSPLLSRSSRLSASRCSPVNRRYLGSGETIRALQRCEYLKLRNVASHQVEVAIIMMEQV